MPEAGSPSTTDLAEDRTILANERTFAGWMRTSLAAVGVGLAFHVLFGKLAPSWLPRAIATVFLGIAILVIALAERRASAVTRRLKPHMIVSAKVLNLRVIAASIVLATAALIGAIWLVSFP